jgi:hypothetical protein
MNEARSLTLVACANGALCLAAGLSYLVVSPTELTISALVVTGILGCCVLIAAGLWQARIHGEGRRLPLIVLGVIALGFVAGSALGFAGAQVARDARLEPTGLPRTLHAAGVLTGIALCLQVIAAIVRTHQRGGIRLRPGRSDSV